MRSKKTYIQVDQKKKNINFQFLIVVSEIHLFYFSKEKNVTMSMLILDNENS